MTMKKKEGWAEFLSLCVASQSHKHMLSELFAILLTADERQNIATRYLILKELLQGERTQREISKSLQVSIGNITRGSHTLKQISPKLKELIKRGNPT